MTATLIRPKLWTPDLADRIVTPRDREFHVVKNSLKSRRHLKPQAAAGFFDVNGTLAPNTTTDITFPSSPTSGMVYLLVHSASGNLSSGTASAGSPTVTMLPTGTPIHSFPAAIKGATDWRIDIWGFACNGTQTAFRYVNSGAAAGTTIIYRCWWASTTARNLSAGSNGSGFHSPFTRSSTVTVGSPVLINVIAWRGTASGSIPLTAAGAIPTSANGSPWLSQDIGGIPQQTWIDTAGASPYSNTISDTSSSDWLSGGWIGSTI